MKWADDCMPIAVRIEVAKRRRKAQVMSPGPLGLAGPDRCARCAKPRTFLPDSDEEVQPLPASTTLATCRHCGGYPALCNCP